MSEPLRALALRWLAWASVARVGGEVFRLAGRLLLARLLWPEAFGSFALAAAVQAVVQVVFELQLTAALVQRSTVTPGLVSTAFWSRAVLGGLAGLVLLGLAGPLAAIVAQPPIAALLRVLSAHSVVAGLMAVPRALLWRDLGFRRLAGMELTGEAFASVVAVLAALAGAGVWSLVAHQIALDLIQLGLVWFLVAWRPGRHWAWQEFLELFRFGYPLVGKGILDHVTLHGDRVVVGIVFGPTVLGFYSLALRLMKETAGAIGGIFERVAFPLFSRTRVDLGRSRRGFLNALRGQGLLTLPLVLGLALTAHELVPLVLGPGWTGAVVFVQVLALRAFCGSLLALPRAVVLAQGIPQLVLGLSLGNSLALALGWLAGSAWGAVGIAAGGGAGVMLLLWLAILLVRSRIPVEPADWLRALAPALVGGLSMTAVIAAASWLMPPSLGPLGRAGLLLGAGAVAYLLPLAPWLAREAQIYRDLWRSRADAVVPVEDTVS